MGNKTAEDVSKKFLSLFNAEEIVEMFIRDINQKKGSFSRWIDLDKFYKWVMQLEVPPSSSFNKHSIFFDEEIFKKDPAAYLDIEQDTNDQGYLPFVSIF